MFDSVGDAIFYRYARATGLPRNSEHTLSISEKLASAGAVPISIITCSFDLIAGLFARFAKHTPFESDEKIKDFSVESLAYGACLFSSPYFLFVRLLHDKAFKITQNHSSGNPYSELINALPKLLADSAYEDSLSQNLIKRQLGARLLYVLTSLSCLVAGLAHAILSLIAVIFSLGSLGRLYAINHLAKRHLTEMMIYMVDKSSKNIERAVFLNR